MAANSRARGFTLVELLVVIGIIALLISILLPALSRAKEQANQVKCLAQVRTLAQGAMLHAQDHKNHLPIAGLQWQMEPRELTPRGLNDPNRQKFIYFSDAGTNRPVPLMAALVIPLRIKVRLDSWQSLQADIRTEGIQKYFRCPSDSTFEEGFSQRSEAGDYPPIMERMSYTFNEAILGWRDWSKTTPRCNITKIKRTAQVMLFGDGRPREPNGWFTIYDRAEWSLWDYEQINPSFTRSFDRSRHRGRMNIVFVDGHADTIVLSRGDMMRVGVSKYVRD
jgi:prepilin-type N-terminal cleavage/methylation domain-containing protein/prepilin-type processing-associated H-X9-DG protein